MKPTLQRFLVHSVLAWLPYAALLTLSTGLLYGTAQYFERQHANDAPLMLAQSTVYELTHGAKAETLGLGSIVPENSLTPFVSIYKTGGTLVGSSQEQGTDKLVGLPPTAVTSIVDADSRRFTWQPQAGHRYAVVAQKYETTSDVGVVVSGASLSDTEQRISRYGRGLFLLWIASLGASLLAIMGWTKLTKHLEQS